MVCTLQIVGISATDPTIPAGIVGTVGLTGLTGLRILRTPTDLFYGKHFCVYIVGACPACKVQGLSN